MSQLPSITLLRYLIEILCQSQNLSETDRFFIGSILEDRDSLIALEIQSIIDDELVQFPFNQRQSFLKIPSQSILGFWEASEFVFIDEFLSSEEIEALLNFALRYEKSFQDSKIVIPSAKEKSQKNHQLRKSQILVDLQEHYTVVVDKIEAILPWIFQSLRYKSFHMSQIDAQLTSSNDGDFYKAHNDNTAEKSRSRELTFVYYFYHEPKAFTGGELRLYDTYIKNNHYAYIKSEFCRTIPPQQNRIIFFPSHLIHEVLPINCKSRLFADSRFTVNGWIHKSETQNY